VDKTPASTVRVAATATSVDVIGAALVCPVGALEHVAGKDVDGVGHRLGPPQIPARRARVLAFANIVMSTPWRYQIVTSRAHTGRVFVRDATDVIGWYGPTC